MCVGPQYVCRPSVCVSFSMCVDPQYVCRPSVCVQALSMCAGPQYVCPSGMCVGLQYVCRPSVCVLAFSMCVYICTLHCVYLSVSQDFLSYSVTRSLNTAAPHNTHTPPLPPFTKIRNVVNFLSSPLILSLLLLTHKYVCTVCTHTHTHTHIHTHTHTHTYTHTHIHTHTPAAL